jgi:hypothetical protein
LNFHAPIFHGTVFNLCIVLGRSYRGPFFLHYFFTFHGSILRLNDNDNTYVDLFSIEISDKINISI